MLRLRIGSARRLPIVNLPPPAVLAVLYLGLIVAGAALLKAPGATTAPLGWFDALFTATSAVTVTGLVVVDTGGHFSLFGQAVIAVLIQLGGLGLMTFAVLVLMLLGQRIGIRHQIILREDLNQTSLGNLARLVGLIARVVLLFELAGAMILAVRWVPVLGWADGIWQAVFHAVSAFNNAGFSLFSDNLGGWVGDPLVIGAISILFMVGGLGFSVLADIYEHRGWARFSLHTKLMLTGTAVLIIWAFAAFLVLEWDNPATLAGLDTAGDRALAAWLQAVTPRTAGFNTLDIGGVNDSTALMLISLMLVGGGSTSTAGGIKVTTFLVLLLATAAFLKRRTTIHAFGRSLGHEETLKVLAVTVLSLLVVMIGTFLVTLTNHAPFLDLAFEVSSAFGTVGLSRGVTGDLDFLGRLVLMITMFIGRVGPLSLGFFLATRAPSRVSYPSSTVHLG